MQQRGRKEEERVRGFQERGGDRRAEMRGQGRKNWDLLRAHAVGPPFLAVDARNTQFVKVERPADVEEGRQKLPIIGYEQEVMEAVTAQDIVVLTGETGCGKTTQVSPEGQGEAEDKDRDRQARPFSSFETCVASPLGSPISVRGGLRLPRLPRAQRYYRHHAAAQGCGHQHSS